MQQTAIAHIQGAVSTLFALLSKGKDLAAIRANPCNVVTGHSPQVFIHTCLTDLEATGTAPAKTAVSPATDTILDQDMLGLLDL
jgi:hypothetical protein